MMDQAWDGCGFSLFSCIDCEAVAHLSSVKKLHISNPPIIKVTGKAFWDIGHAPANHSNRRTDLQDYAAWEIHPVLKLTVMTLR
jgi:hypothetical protein